MSELDQIRERLEAASDGPWRWDEEFGDEGDTGLALTNDAGAEIVSAYNHHCCSFRDDPLVEDNDAEFIASAPTDISKLLRALDAVNDWLLNLDAIEEVHPSSARHLNVSAGATASAIRAAITAALGGDK